VHGEKQYSLVQSPESNRVPGKANYYDD